MKRIAIVGGKSSLAKYLIPVLSQKNEIILLGRKDCDIYCDVQDNLESIIIPKDVDVVIHTAAAYKGTTDEEIIQTEEINAIGTLKICMAAKKANVKHLVLISSQYAILNESSSYYNIYSISKNHSDELATYYCKQNNLPFTILRPSPLYDTKDEYKNHQPLMYLIIDSAEDRKNIQIYGQNDALRNYLHVEDLVEIISKVIEKKYVGVHSCTYPKDYKLSEMAKIALTNFNNGGDIVFMKDKPNISDNIFPKDFSLYDKIGFYPIIDFETGIKKIIEYRKGGKS